MPIVSFTGPVMGSGHDLLHGNLPVAFDEAQLKCCGFVQLSTFLCPGKPEKTPFKGYHPFQVFVIFPIHANPWTTLCKRMIDRRDSQFQPGAPFTCTGKVAGLLAHNVMQQPPAIEQDYIFIVVPDTWTFLDKANFNQPPAAQVSPATPRRPTSGTANYDDVLARFTSTKKRQFNPVTPSSLPPTSAGASVNRPLPGPHETPTKKPRLSPTPSTVIAVDDTGSSDSQDDFDDAHDADPADAADDTDVADDADDDNNIPNSVTVQTVSQDVVDSTSTKTSNSDLSRPHRTRQPPKKYPHAG